MTDSILNLRGQTVPGAQDGSVPGASDLASRLSGGDSQAGETFGFVLKYCSLILVAPILTFFLAKTVLLERFFGFGSDDVAINVVSALSAVVVLHVGLGAFIYKAYFAETSAPKVKIGKQE